MGRRSLKRPATSAIQQPTDTPSRLDSASADNREPMVPDAPRTLNADTNLDELMHALVGTGAATATMTDLRSDRTSEVERRLADVILAVGLDSSESRPVVTTQTSASANATLSASTSRLFADRPSPSDKASRWWRRVWPGVGPAARPSAAPTDEPTLPQATDRRSAPPIAPSRLARLLCGLSGHDHLLTVEDERVFLRCMSCGHESPGWNRGDHRPVVKWARARRPTAIADFARARRSWLMPRTRPVAVNGGSPGRPLRRQRGL